MKLYEIIRRSLYGLCAAYHRIIGQVVDRQPPVSHFTRGSIAATKYFFEKNKNKIPIVSRFIHSVPWRIVPGGYYSMNFPTFSSERIFRFFKRNLSICSRSYLVTLSLILTEFNSIRWFSIDLIKEPIREREGRDVSRCRISILVRTTPSSGRCHHLVHLDADDDATRHLVSTCVLRSSMVPHTVAMFCELN